MSNRDEPKARSSLRSNDYPPGELGELGSDHVFNNVGLPLISFNRIDQK